MTGVPEVLLRFPGWTSSITKWQKHKEFGTGVSLQRTGRSRQLNAVDILWIIRWS